MAFWNEAGSDPKRAFRFKVNFGLINGSNNESVYLAQTAKRPTFTITDTTKVDFMDKSFHFPGKVTWEPVTIKFVDTVDVNVSAKTYQYLKSAGWISPGDTNFTPANLGSAGAGLKTIGKGEAKSKTQDISIQVLKPDGTVVDTWILNNAFITKATFNDLSYASEEILTVEYAVRYDWADFK
jgi:hypothetical protein